MSESQRRPCTVPTRAHPLVRTLFARMAEQRLTYDQLAARSGQKRSCIKAWRSHNAPGTQAIQATLKVVDLQALPVPQFKTLPAALAGELEAIGKRHGIPAPVAEFMIVAAHRAPEQHHHERQAQ